MMQEKIKMFFKRWNKIDYFIIFLFTTIFFLSLQPFPSLADGDSFYHAKIADLMIKNKGPILSFPWLPFTVFQDFYYDHHFLFHIYLIPFILLIKNPLISIKVATVILAGIFFTLFYWLLKKYSIKWPFFYLILVLSSYSIVWRLSLDKAPAASLILLLLGVYFLLKRKKFYLFLISFLYVWLYNAWPLLFVAVLAYCFIDFLKTFIFQEEHIKLNGFWDKVNQALKQFFKKENVALILSCLLGIIFGIIINPYFPSNLHFFLVHIFQIGVITKNLKYGMGSEWYPIDPWKFLSQNFLVCLLWLMSLFFAFYRKKEVLKNKESFFFLLFSLFFFVFTLKARRMGEYFIPFAVLTFAFVFDAYFKEAPWKMYWYNIKQIFTSQNFLIINIIVASAFIYAAGSFLIFTDNLYTGIIEYFDKSAPRFENFQKVSNFIKENIPPKTIIFHSGWDFFPQLFYHNDQNYYIVGLDITFMREKNSELFDLWHKITNGEEKDNLGEKIKNNFSASYVLAHKPNNTHRYGERFVDNLLHNDQFEKIYEDNEAYVFKIK
jgi:hypothetical protein